MTDSINNSADIIDLRDVLTRFEELETLLEPQDNADPIMESEDYTEEREEFKALGDLLDSLKGYGGDEQWRGDWYPLTLIARSYFVEYCRDLVSDIGDMPREIPAYIEIDWNKTADNLEVDYSSVDFDGHEFLYR